MGEQGIFAMAAEFYRELEASEIRGLFPGDMQEASKKLAMFLVSACGGPPLYQAAFGPPRMRMRHMPFAIGPKERDAWLACFFKVLERAPEAHGFPKEQLQAFKDYLDRFSAWMVNRSA
jgi:hemoglobin